MKYSPAAFLFICIYLYRPNKQNFISWPSEVLKARISLGRELQFLLVGEKGSLLFCFNFGWCAAERCHGTDSNLPPTKEAQSSLTKARHHSQCAAAELRAHPCHTKFDESLPRQSFWNKRLQSYGLNSESFWHLISVIKSSDWWLNQ